MLTSHARWQAAGHLGDTLKAMRKSFDEAREKAPCILFVDEVDSIGNRDTLTGDWANYAREIVNAFLDCLDGAEAREGVVVVAATNNPDLLDPAARRPGRLDRHVVIPLPDTPARVGILCWHAKAGLPDGQLREVAERTEGFSGAALEQLVRQARRVARRSNRDMTLADLLSELPVLVPVSTESLWRTAIHEAGHAVVGLAVGRWRILTAYVASSVAAHAGSVQAGGVEFSGAGELRHASAEDYRARIVRCLGGLAAEEVLLGHRTDGGGGIVGSDLHNATVAAAAMEASFGLGSGLAYLSGLEPEELLRIVQLDRLVRDRVEKTLSECFDRARDIVRQRQFDVERLARELCGRGRLTGAEIDEVLEAKPQLEVVLPS